MAVVTKSCLALLAPAWGGKTVAHSERSGTALPIEPQEEDQQKRLAQFLTPAPVADFMASLLELGSTEIRFLDAGAGDGALTAALVRRFCEKRQGVKTIAVVAYELDEHILSRLQQTMDQCRAECSHAGLEFTYEIRHEDFIEAAAGLARGDFFSQLQAPFNVAILNPPYRKINSYSLTRRSLRSVGIETTNLYTGFLALAAKLLGEDGEMVAITPRSFCNGPYFKPFRELFLGLMSLRRLHVFESRAAAFQRDGVLQENIILHAVKSPVKPGRLFVSSSSGTPGGRVRERQSPYEEVVNPDDAEQFIHLVMDEKELDAKRRMEGLVTPLVDLGLAVSTGRVVGFRARQFAVCDPTQDTVPLIHPCHCNGGFVNWPKQGGRKPNAIRNTEATKELLVPEGIYVLVKRFTSKEERRRVVACIYDPARIHAEQVGFENHLNYFHATGHGLSMDLAKGLVAFLNSTFVDVYFRQFNGHTQVNATDLKNLYYPRRHALETLGQKIGNCFPDQTELDRLIQKELFQ